MAEAPLLSARGVCKEFGGLMAVSHVDFDVFAGDILAIIGPNGAGKTTLFNLVTGIHSLDSGKVTFNGHAISTSKSYQIAQLGVARTFQNLQVFGNMTVLENVMLGRHGRSRSGLIASALRLPSVRREEQDIRARSQAFLEMVGLGAHAHDMASGLSFGQQRMLELARSLATEPHLLLLDEPAAGLTRHETDELIALLRQMRDEGLTVVLVEHDMEMVMDIADRVVVMQYGRKIADGTPAEVQEDQHVIAAYLGYDWDIGLGAKDIAAAETAQTAAPYEEERSSPHA